MSESIQWNERPEDVFVAGYANYVSAITEALTALVRSYAARIEAWMKQNAIWQDQTGNARQGLHVEVEEMANSIALHLMHSVDYGIWLELAHQSQYSILLPALDKFAAELWQDVQRLFE